MEPKSTDSLRSAGLMQMLNGLGLQLMAIRQPNMWVVKFGTGSLLLAGATLLPSTLFFRYLLRENLTTELHHSSLEMSKVGGLSTFAAWLLMILN